MNKGRIFLLVAIVCSLMAAYVSYALVLKHVTGKSDASWFDLGCSDDAGPGGANCAAVLASPYSYFPPRTEGRSGGIPVAFLGLVYYSALGIWFAGVGAPSMARRRLHLLPMLTVGFGLAGSAYFMLIMFGKLDQWCTWCLVTHGLNLVIAICVVLMWPLAKAEDDSSSNEKSRISPVHPSWRVVFVTILAICCAGAAEVELLRFEMLARSAVNMNKQLDQYKAYVGRIKSNGALFVAMWKTQDEVTIARRDDDPVRHENGGDVDPLDVVVFSDFECPSCARFAIFFEKNVVPLFGGHIRTTFKHYPIDRTCNALASRTLHPYACEAAEMAEAARAVGGSEAFWKAHDYLYRNRTALAAGRIGLGDVASAIGIDESAMSPHVTSAATTARIKEDIALAGTLGVRGTPAVYVDGKVVDQLAKIEVAFWDKMADDYFVRVGVSRPASTRPQKKSVTQGSQGRKVAP